MWTIRQEQIETFRRATLQQFEDRMVTHLQQFAPRHWRVMSEADGRKVIRLGIDRAAQRGFTNEGPVRFFIELMFMFGSYFDTDLQHPWATAILEDSAFPDQIARADLLYDAASEYLAKVSGPNHKYLKSAMQRLSEARIEDFYGPDDGLPDRLLNGVQAIYPEKCTYLGQEVLKKLINRGLMIAMQQGFFREKGKILMVALTFSIGHGFPDDLLYGWIARRLDQQRWPDEAVRTQHLYIAATTYLKHVVAENNQG